VVTALLVITQKNIVHCAVSLAGTLLSVAGIFLTLHAEFLAGVQVIVYVGGILVLFVFVIMLIALERSLTERQYHRQKIFAVLTTLALAGVTVYALVSGEGSLRPVPPGVPAASAAQNAEVVGMTLYRNYLLPFEIASILLLVAIVGAVALSKKRTEAEKA
jgi:NADH-quinone oxidoreductase subunit J